MYLPCCQLYTLVKKVLFSNQWDSLLSNEMKGLEAEGENNLRESGKQPKKAIRNQGRQAIVLGACLGWKIFQ